MTDTAAAAESDEIQHGTVLTDNADPEDRKPWTVKGMPEWVIDLARTAAKARRMSMGGWLAEVIPRAVHPQPDQRPQAVANVPAVIAPKTTPDLAEISQIAEIAKLVSAIEGLPPSVLKETHGLLRDRLKAVRRGG